MIRKGTAGARGSYSPCTCQRGEHVSLARNVNTRRGPYPRKGRGGLAEVKMVRSWGSPRPPGDLRCSDTQRRSATMCGAESPQSSTACHGERPMHRRAAAQRRNRRGDSAPPRAAPHLERQQPHVLPRPGEPPRRRRRLRRRRVVRAQGREPRQSRLKRRERAAQARRARARLAVERGHAADHQRVEQAWHVAQQVPAPRPQAANPDKQPCIAGEPVERIDSQRAVSFQRESGRRQWTRFADKNAQAAGPPPTGSAPAAARRPRARRPAPGAGRASRPAAPARRPAPGPPACTAALSGAAPPPVAPPPHTHTQPPRPFSLGESPANLLNQLRC